MKNITVRELIEKLSEFPDECEVRIFESHFENIIEVCEISEKVFGYEEDDDEPDIVYITGWAD